jgi:hypothetical protein
MAMQPGSQHLCRTCAGSRVVTEQRTKDGKTVTVKVPCPVCQGKQAGYHTK